MMWQTATVVAWRLLHCAFQATQFEKCQGNFFTVFHMQGERGQTGEGQRKKPHAALRQGRRQIGPPSFNYSSKAPILGTSSCALL